jgi:hypothetical protein
MDQINIVELDRQIVKAEQMLKDQLWLIEQTREAWTQLKMQKSLLFVATGKGSPR